MSATEMQKTLNALGLCARARKLITGTPMVCDALKHRKPPVFLVLSAKDNAENTAKRLSDRCRFYEVPLVTPEIDGAALARAIGKSGHVAAVAITDEHLCRLVETTLKTI